MDVRGRSGANGGAMSEMVDRHVDLHNDNFHQNHPRPRQSDNAMRSCLPRSSCPNQWRLWASFGRWQWTRPEKQRISQLHLFGLLSLLCFATLGSSTRVGGSSSSSSSSSSSTSAAKLGSAGGGGGLSNTSLRNIEDENGKTRRNSQSAVLVNGTLVSVPPLL